MADKQTTFETTVPERPAVMDVLHEHLEEVAHLSIQWRKLIFSPEIPLRRLPRHTERIAAHLDGLQVGGAAAEQMAAAMLAGDDPWFVHAAARVWMEQARPDAKAVQARLAAVPPEMRGAWREALRRLPASAVNPVLPPGEFASLPVAVLEVAVDVWGWHGLLAPQTAESLAATPEAGVRRALARHAGQPAILARLLEDQDLLVRRMALWSLSLQNPGAALDLGRRAAAAARPDAFALRVIGLLGERADGERLLPLLPQKEFSAPALLALRDLGCVEYAEAVLACLEGDNAEAAILAKEVFESLAGRILSREGGRPLPTGISPARFHWEQVRKNSSSSGRSLFGRPFPWLGDAAEEPMAWVWRRTLAGGPPDLAWLRREVPDGFFTGVDSFEAITGE